MFLKRHGQKSQKELNDSNKYFRKLSDCSICQAKALIQQICQIHKTIRVVKKDKIGRVLNWLEIFYQI